MRKLLLVTILLLGANGALGQPVIASVVVRTPDPRWRSGAPHSAEPGLASVTLGAAAGFAVGAAIGGTAGAAYAARTDLSGDYAGFAYFSRSGVVGAALGGAVGAATGAHLTNGRRGSFGRTLLVTTAAQALWLSGALLVDDGHKVIFVLPLPIIGVAAAVATERITGR